VIMDRDARPLMGQAEFYDAIRSLMLELRQDGELAELGIDGMDNDSLMTCSVWELGFDSALVIELAIFVEDLGAELPDDLPWASLTVADLYSAYLNARVDDDLRPSRRSD
jgi:hypothetical protein